MQIKWIQKYPKMNVCLCIASSCKLNLGVRVRYYFCIENQIFRIMLIHASTPWPWIPPIRFTLLFDQALSSHLTQSTYWGFFKLPRLCIVHYKEFKVWPWNEPIRRLPMVVIWKYKRSVEKWNSCFATLKYLSVQSSSLLGTSSAEGNLAYAELC